jgi:hypothetical protein
MPLKDLVQSATEKLKKLKFEALDEGGGERHGAWEWTWVGPRNGGGHCYASLGAVELAAGKYLMEVRAGADNGLRFGRCLVSKFPDIKDLGSQTSHLDDIVESVLEAAKLASTLSDADLTDYYDRRTTHL